MWLKSEVATELDRWLFLELPESNVAFRWHILKKYEQSRS